MRDEAGRETADFHLVIPSFEEGGRLPAYLGDLVGLLKDKEYSARILVVDDGSSSQEQQRLKEIISALGSPGNPTVDALVLPRNMGKGYAVRHGWHAGKLAKWVAFADADGATPAYEVVRVFDTVYRANDPTRCYLGSRVRMLGRSVDRRWKRHIIGRLYATLVGLVINESIYDSQCGFKVIPARAFAAIASMLQEDRFAFDSELIAALSEAGYRLEETPVDWKDIPGSKVSLVKDSVRMVRSLMQIRGRKRAGAYRARPYGSD